MLITHIEQSPPLEANLVGLKIKRLLNEIEVLFQICFKIKKGLQFIPLPVCRFNPTKLALEGVGGGLRIPDKNQIL